MRLARGSATSTAASSLNNTRQRGVTQARQAEVPSLGAAKTLGNSRVRRRRTLCRQPTASPTPSPAASHWAAVLARPVSPGIRPVLPAPARYQSTAPRLRSRVPASTAVTSFSVAHTSTPRPTIVPPAPCPRPRRDSAGRRPYSRCLRLRRPLRRRRWPRRGRRRISAPAPHAHITPPPPHLPTPPHPTTPFPLLTSSTTHPPPTPPSAPPHSSPHSTSASITLPIASTR